MMRKISALILMAVGLLCVIFSGWKIWESRQSQVSTLHQARSMIQEIGSSVKVKSLSHAIVKDKNIIGLLEIPKLEKEIPVIEGTLPEQLAKGVGHYKTTSLPGGHDQIVLSGHRDTVFQHFGDLEKGDTVTLKLQNGSFTYVIDHMKIVNAEDRTIIHPTKPKEELVLTTCYPFHFVGNAPKRYIIYAYPKTT
jgi:sortase A